MMRFQWTVILIAFCSMGCRNSGTRSACCPQSGQMHPAAVGRANAGLQPGVAAGTTITAGLPPVPGLNAEQRDMDRRVGNQAYELDPRSNLSTEQMIINADQSAGGQSSTR